MPWPIADAFGIHHELDCQHSERVWRREGGRWTCNGCGQQSPPPAKREGES